MPIRKWNELNPASWLALIQEHGASSVHLTGGEPLLYSELIPLIGTLKEAGVKASMLSNGSLPQVVEQNQKVFQDLNAAQISLDSTDPLVHDSRRGSQGAHSNVMITLGVLRRLEIPLAVSMVVDEKTISSVHAMAQFCCEIGAKLILRPLAQIGRSNRSFEFDPAFVSDYEEIIVPDPFGYGAPSIGGHVSQRTLNPAGQLVAA